MNIENISALAMQLHSLGFENVGYSLLKRISFKPSHFTLSEKIDKGKDRLTFLLFLEKQAKENIYALVYYDVTLHKEAVFIDAVFNEINIAGLEQSMASIDWKDAFDFITKKKLNLDDRSTWENEHKIECVIEDLSALEQYEEGKVFSVGLKLKYWAGLPYQDLFGTISPLKNKSEVSQRFYFFDTQGGISVDEAYRFLQNKQLEKQVQAKRKHADSIDSGGNKNDQQSSSGVSLLHKKRIARTNTGKSKSKVSVK